MKCVKIYYNGNEFVFDKELIDLPMKDPKDPTIHFAENEKNAEQITNKLNMELKKSIDELVEWNDFVIKKCKNCGEYYIITKDEADWFKDKGFSLPVRCLDCRRERKKNKK